MIDLKIALCYADPDIVNIFNRYKWGLARLGVDFNEEVLDAIEFHAVDLGNSLRAFCAWILYKRELGETFDTETLNQTLVRAIKERWTPTTYQAKYLKKSDRIFESARWTIWEKAAEILGYDRRNQLIADVTEKCELVYIDRVDVFKLVSDRDLEKLKSYLRNKEYLAL